MQLPEEAINAVVDPDPETQIKVMCLRVHAQPACVAGKLGKAWEGRHGELCCDRNSGGMIVAGAGVARTRLQQRGFFVQGDGEGLHKCGFLYGFCSLGRTALLVCTSVR